MKKILILCFISSFVFCQEGAFFKKIANGYSYRVFSFIKKNKQEYLLEMLIYPDSDTRTKTYFGRILSKNSSEVDVEILEESYMKNKHKGTFSPFKAYGITNLSKENGSYKKQYKNMVFKNKTLYFGNSKYLSYENEIENAFDKKDAKTLLKLYQFHIYLIQSFVKGFGSMKMLNYHSKVEGFVDGYVKYDFEPRGKGVGILKKNTGLESEFYHFEVFKNISINGSIFGGKSHLEEFLQVNINKDKFFKIYFDNVFVKKGIANNGYYKVVLSSDNSELKVNYDVLAP